MKKIIVVLMMLGQMVCFGQAGNWLWAKQGVGNQEGYSVATDTSGNVYATGISVGFPATFGSYTLANAGNSDLFVVKYSPSGTVLWAKGAGGAGSDLGNSIATDHFGNVYVTGYFASPAIVFGSTTLTNIGTANSEDMFIVKYDTNGNVVWAKSINGTIGESGHSVTTDINGNVYVAGTFTSPSVVIGTNTLTNLTAFNEDIFIVKYSSSGAVIWAKKAGGMADDIPNSIASDVSGNIFLTGYSQSPSLSFDTISIINTDNVDMFIVKYDSSGNPLWAKKGSGAFENEGNSLATDGSGNVYVTGYYYGATVNFGALTLTNFGGWDVFVTKYSTSGTVLWAKTIGGIGDEIGYSITTDASGFYVTGSSNDSLIVLNSDTLLIPNTIFDDPIFLIKCDSTGSLICGSALTSGGDDNDAVAADGLGNVYLAGDFYGSNPFIIGTNTLSLSGSGGENFYIAKFNCNGKGNSILEHTDPQSPIEIYPNPATNSITISFSEEFFKGRTSNPTIQILNLLGESVLQPHPFRGSREGQIDISDMAEGMYFVTIKTEEGLETRKLMVER